MYLQEPLLDHSLGVLGVDGGGEVDELLLLGDHAHDVLVPEHILLELQVVDSL